MDLRLTGKSVLVTGASQGIGRAVAETLAAEGVASLHLAARSREGLEAVAKDLRGRHGTKVSVHPLDLAKRGAAKSLAELVGDVDILVNNAGAIPGGTIAEIDEDRWRDAWDLKVFGYINLTREVYRRMKAKHAGVIVNVIGMAGERPMAGYIAGSTGNAGLMAFTRALGGGAPDDGIRVVAVNPGLVATERLKAILGTRAEQTLGDRSKWPELLKLQPFGRAAEPHEVADVVAFLASSRSSYVSGTVVTIDAGAAQRNYSY